MSSISESSLNNLNTAIGQMGFSAINAEEAHRLLGLYGINGVQGLIAAARSGDGESKAKINQGINAAKANVYLADLDIHDFTTADLLKVFIAKGAKATHDLLGQVASGEPNAMAIIRELAARPAAGANARVEDLGAPMHATDVAPPGNAPAPPRQSAQAFRNESEGPRRPANVTQMPVRNAPPAADSLDDDEPTHERYAPPQQVQQVQPGNAGPNGERRYDQYSCFGKDTAIQFERTPNMRRTTNTINIKIAKEKVKGRTCKEGVDWQNGVVIMLEAYEIQLIYAVMMGMGPKFRAAGHGADNMKWIEVEETTGDWAGSVRFTIGVGKTDIRRVNVSFTDIKKVMEVFSRTLQDQGSGQSPVWMLAELRRVYDLYAKKTAASAARQGGQRNQAHG